MAFTQPIAQTDLGYAPYNCFLFEAENRGKEVHLVNQPPTDKADPNLLGTFDDTSNSAGRYYKDANNLPWGLHLPVVFEYPQEYESIRGAFLHFDTWVQHGGQRYPDWYLDNSGYRNSGKIYR